MVASENKKSRSVGSFQEPDIFQNMLIKMIPSGYIRESKCRRRWWHTNTQRGGFGNGPLKRKRQDIFENLGLKWCPRVTSENKNLGRDDDTTGWVWEGIPNKSQERKYGIEIVAVGGIWESKGKTLIRGIVYPLTKVKRFLKIWY